MTDQIKKVLDALTANMTEEQQIVMAVSLQHEYICNCDTCLSWWAQMGPDGYEPGQYGPFTTETINARQRELGLEVTL